MEDYKFVVKNPSFLNSRRKRKFVLKKFLITVSLILTIICAGYIYNYYKAHFHLPFYTENFKILNIHNISKKQMEAILQKYKGKSLKELSLNKIYSEIKSLEWVKDVTIHKNYPSTLIVDVTEAKPLCVIALKNRFYLLGDNGKIIKNFNHKLLEKNFFILTLKNVNLFQKNKEKYLSLIESIKKSSIKNISEIVVDDNLIIFTYNPDIKYIVDIDHIDENLAKVKLLQKIKKQLSLKEKGFRTINLKYNNKIFIKL